MKNFTQELKDIIKEDPGRPILSPDDVRGRANTMVVLTNQAPPKLLALGGSSRKAILVNYEPLMITFPNQKGVYKVQADDIVFENHHTGRDVTEAGAEETSYEKFFASAMKKFGVASPIELSPDDTKKFFNYVDKNWDAEEESDGSQSESGWEDPPKLGGEPSLITPVEGDDSKTEILPALARGAMAVGKIAGKLGGDDNEDTLESDMTEKRKKPKKKKKNKKAQQDRERQQAEREREQGQIDREREAKEKEYIAAAAEKAREREDAERDRARARGQKDREDDQREKSKKKSGGGLGLGSALKDLGQYTIAKAQSGGK